VSVFYRSSRQGLVQALEELQPQVAHAPDGEEYGNVCLNPDRQAPVVISFHAICRETRERMLELIKALATLPEPSLRVARRTGDRGYTAAAAKRIPDLGLGDRATLLSQLEAGGMLDERRQRVMDERTRETFAAGARKRAQQFRARGVARNVRNVYEEARS
jgi:hypothetical protein